MDAGGGRSGGELQLVARALLGERHFQPVLARGFGFGPILGLRRFAFSRREVVEYIGLVDNGSSVEYGNGNSISH